MLVGFGGGFRWLLVGSCSLDRCLLVLVVGFGDCLGIWIGVCWFGWWDWVMVVWAGFGDGFLVVVELGVVVGWLSFFVVDGGGLWGWWLSFLFFFFLVVK